MTISAGIHGSNRDEGGIIESFFFFFNLIFMALTVPVNSTRRLQLLFQTITSKLHILKLDVKVLY